jgi:hypothetical protein
MHPPPHGLSCARSYTSTAVDARAYIDRYAVIRDSKATRLGISQDYASTCTKSAT